MRLFLLSSALLLSACFDSGTSVYNRAGERVGSVSEQSGEAATVYGSDGGSVGRVSGNEVYHSGGSYVGRVTEGDDIYDSGGSYRGRVSSGTRCIDRGGTRVGYLNSDIDDEAAGGACLLLLLLNP